MGIPGQAGDDTRCELFHRDEGDGALADLDRLADVNTLLGLLGRIVCPAFLQLFRAAVEGLDSGLALEARDVQLEFVVAVRALVDHEEALLLAVFGVVGRDERFLVTGNFGLVL